MFARFHALRFYMYATVLVLFLLLLLSYYRSDNSTVDNRPLAQLHFNEIYDRLNTIYLDRKEPNSLESKRRALVNELHRQGWIRPQYLDEILDDTVVNGMYIGEVRAVLGNPKQIVVFKWGIRSLDSAQLQFCLNKTCDKVLVTVFRKGLLFYFAQGKEHELPS